MLLVSLLAKVWTWNIQSGHPFTVQRSEKDTSLRENGVDGIYYRYICISCHEGTLFRMLF